MDNGTNDTPTTLNTPDANATKDAATVDETPALTLVADAPAEMLDITAEEVFTANDVRMTTVNVDEWKKGAVIYIHTPSAADKDFLENSLVWGRDENDVSVRKQIGPDSIRAYIVAMCARNSKGERIFSADNVERLKNKSVVPMDRLFDAIIRMSIVTERDVATMAKNFAAANTDNS